jgi:hypothetical protein
MAWEKDPDRFECIIKDRLDSTEGRPETWVMLLSKLSCRSGPLLKLDPDVCLRDRI